MPMPSSLLLQYLLVLELVRASALLERRLRFLEVRAVVLGPDDGEDDDVCGDDADEDALHFGVVGHVLDLPVGDYRRAEVSTTGCSFSETKKGKKMLEWF